MTTSEQISTMSYNTWKENRQTSVDKLRELADAIDKIKQRGHLANIAGSSAGIVASVISIGLMIAIPFTGGMSLAGVVVAGAVGGSGAAASIGASIGTWVHVKYKMKEVQKVLNKDRHTSQLLIDESTSVGIKKGIPKAIRVGKGIVTGTKISAGIVENIIKHSAHSLAALNAAGKAVKVVHSVGNIASVVGIISLPLNIVDLVSNAMDVHKKTPHETAELIRDIANDLESTLYNF